MKWSYDPRNHFKAWAHPRWLSCRRGHRTRHAIRVFEGGVLVRSFPFSNTVLVTGVREEAKRCWNFGSHAPWTKLVVSSSLATITRLSTGLNPEDVVKAVANLLVDSAGFASFDVSFGLTEANLTWSRVGIKNDSGVYLLIGSIPPPGFTKSGSQTVQVFGQIEYEA